LVNAKSFIVQVIAFTLAVEFVGMILIYYAVPQAVFTTQSDRLFFALFHSVSAFNNAGFSTQTLGMYELPFRFNYSLMWILALLLIFGGLGFGIIFNFSRYVQLWVRGRVRRLLTGVPCERHPRLVNISTRLVLKVTALLIVVGTVAIMVFEWNGALAEHPTWWGRFTTAFMTGVTPRTAGFNVVDYGALSVPTLMITLLRHGTGSQTGGVQRPRDQQPEHPPGLRRHRAFAGVPGPFHHHHRLTGKGARPASHRL
jgi:Trk-type K+ transport system membrane component